MSGQPPTDGPGKMLRDYKNIKVNLALGTPVTVAVNNYRNHSYGSPGVGTQDAMQIKDALMSLDWKDVLTRSGGPRPYMRVFAGKGSPKEIAKVLQTLYHYCTVDPGKFDRVFNGRGGVCMKVAGLLHDRFFDVEVPIWEARLRWQARLQNVTNEVIGLDCNGFVGNWLAEAAPTLNLGPETPESHMLDEAKRLHTPIRRTVAEIQGTDIILWEDKRHIAAVDSVVNRASGEFMICQSAAGGPRSDKYTITEQRLTQPPRPGFKLVGGPRGGSVEVFTLWK